MKLQASSRWYMIGSQPEMVGAMAYASRYTDSPSVHINISQPQKKKANGRYATHAAKLRITLTPEDALALASQLTRLANGILTETPVTAGDN